MGVRGSSLFYFSFCAPCPPREEFRRNLSHLHHDNSQFGNEVLRLNMVIEEHQKEVRDHEDMLEALMQELQSRKPQF